jgi:hypothetical protein
MRGVPTLGSFGHCQLSFRLTFEPTRVQQLTLERRREAPRHRLACALSEVRKSRRGRSGRVLEVISRLVSVHGSRKYLRSDIGPEFIC